MGASFLNTLGHPEWVSSDEPAYVAAAVRLAADCQDLRTGRAGLRARMAASPLCDIDTWVVQLEALYERMWAVYCSGSGQRLLPAATSRRPRHAKVDSGT